MTCHPEAQIPSPAVTTSWRIWLGRGNGGEHSFEHASCAPKWPATQVSIVNINIAKDYFRSLHTIFY